MFLMLLRKINKNRWMMMCLLFGLVLTVSIISSASMYSRAVMQRILTSDLNELAAQNKVYAGGYDVIKRLEAGLTSSDQKEKSKNLKELKKQAGISSMGINIPILSKKEVLKAENFGVITTADNLETVIRPEINIEGISNMQEHVKILRGRMFSGQKNENNEYEVIASEKTMNELKLILDRPYSMSLMREDITGKPFTIRVVGVYSYLDEADPYWGDEEWTRPSSIIMDSTLFEAVFMKDEDMALNVMEWYYAYDYVKLKPDNLKSIVEEIQNQDALLSKDYDADATFFGESILEKYAGKEQNIKTVLWILQTPILLMLLIYLSMLASLIVEQDKNEIAVLKSRGGRNYQILLMYLLQSIVMGGIALAIGPYLGVFLCKIIGSSNGFMQFVQRVPLSVQLTPNEYIYSLAAALLFVLVMMFPVVSACRTTIVIHKQKRFRFNTPPFWKKYFLDLVFAALVGYGFYTYSARQKVVQASGNAQNLLVDPLMYLISTFFILAAGLLFLRIYPYMIRFLFWIGKRLWSPAAYTSLINVGRSDGKNQFLMMFLILTISIGIFNVKTAGSINGNVEDKVRYLSGADMVLAEEEKIDDTGRPDIDNNMLSTVAGFNGVEAATKVFTEKSADIKFGEVEFGGVNLMGVTPDEFGRIAWFKSGIMEYPWQEYLNLISKEPRAMLLSRSFKEKYKLKEGDTIYIRWKGGLYVEGFVGAFIDYWPAYNLNAYDTRNLVVANIQYLNKGTLTWPYEVWVKKDSKDASEKIYNAVNEKELKLQKWVDADQKLVKEKNDAMLQGTNGTLTLGFITTMLITIIGFIIYWLLSIKSRTLQFGILRAMGLSLKKLIGVLIYEQVLISGIAIIIGIVIGEIDGKIFVPMINLSSSLGGQVLPFRVMSSRGDYINFFVICGLMFVFGILILISYVAKIKIDQAIKLGED